MQGQVRRISTFQEFWPYFLSEHSKPATKRIHLVGMLLGIACCGVGVSLRNPFWILLGFGLGYACAWYSHFFIQKNKPATFQYPLWSFVSAFKMYWLTLTRQL